MLNDLVFLVPGFLGFDHFGGFPYFSQSVAVALRVALAYELGSDAELKICPLTTVPAGSLAERQMSLSQQAVKTLTKLGRIGDPPRIHFVGHSTGGLDAELFVHRLPLERAGWSADEVRVRKSVRSVTCLAAPAAGSGIPASPLGRLLATEPAQSWFQFDTWRSKLGNAAGARELEQVIEAAFALGLTNVALGQLLAGGLDDPHPLLRFLKSLLGDRTLLHDLRPDVTADLLAPTGELDTGSGAAFQLRRYLTVAANEPQPTPGGRLFALLRNACAEGLRGDATARRVANVLEAARNENKLKVIGNAAVNMPTLTEEESDGVVNVALQLPRGDESSLPKALEQVAALVVADHLDVLGGFPMTDASVTADSPANDFLNSGSLFRGPQFSQLYRAIANDIARAAQSR